jgi:hypothetical protein
MIVGGAVVSASLLEGIEGLSVPLNRPLDRALEQPCGVADSFKVQAWIKTFNFFRFNLKKEREIQFFAPNG